MKSGPRLLVIAGVVAGVTALVGVSLPPRAVEVRVADDLARPGEPFVLAAKVVAGRLRGTFGGVGGARVSFEIDGERAGAAETDSTGKAAVRFAMKTPGEYELFARAELPSKAHLPLAVGLVRVLDPDEAILVTDIDGTLADASVYGPLFHDVREIRPLPGAAEALRELARDFVIVYVTGRDEDLEPHTRAWLKEWDFPAGPVLHSRSLHDPFDTANFKRETLRLLRKKFPRILAGVGDSASDAEAYAAASIPAYLLGKFRQPPPGAQAFPDWAVLASALEALRYGR